jgi:hypothetical protein
VLQKEARLAEKVSDDQDVTLWGIYKDLKWENREVPVSFANSGVHTY